MGVRRTAFLGAAFAALLMFAPSAAARPIVLAPNATPADEPVQATGSIVYAWQGDPARGCAQAGVCGVHGALVFQPQGDADVVEFGPLGNAVEFAGQSATVRVQGGDLGPGGECVDQVEGDTSFLELRAKPGGAVAMTFAGAVSSGRCAGPLAQDLARLLVRGRRSRARRPSYDLRGSLPFAAGPFSGTVVSTLELRPPPPSPGGVFSGGFGDGGGGSSSGPAPHKVLVEEVDLRYRVTAAPSTFAFPFAGEPGPFCTALNSCGARGSLSLAFPRLMREVEISASREVKRRVSRRQALRDFRAGKLPILGGPPLSWVAPRLTESFADQGSCTDSVPAPQLALDFGSFFPSRRGLQIAITGAGGADPLRTHCPGPEAADVVPNGSGALAGAHVPRSQLLERRWTFTLRAAGGFAGTGYSGTRSGQLAVAMSLLKVIAGTHAEQA